MTYQKDSRSEQRVVIGRTQAGLPRTYRLVRPRSRSVWFVTVLRRLYQPD